MIRNYSPTMKKSKHLLKKHEIKIDIIDGTALHARKLDILNFNSHDSNDRAHSIDYRIPNIFSFFNSTNLNFLIFLFYFLFLFSSYHFHSLLISLLFFLAKYSLHIIFNNLI